MFSQALFALLASTAYVGASPLSRRAVVAHDSIAPLAENVPSDTIGNAVKKFAPLLHIAHGCQSYPAVDDAGNTSGGLQDTGSATGGCRDTSKGQTYVRTADHNGRFAIMYSWYFPKDQPSDGVSTGAHRHDWENVVIFLDSAEAANLVGAGASGHGEYKKTTTPQTDSSGRPKVEYFTNFPTNHELQFTDTMGKADIPLIYYDSMTQAARDALENADFGSANVPFKTANFNGNLDKAAA